MSAKSRSLLPGTGFRVQLTLNPEPSAYRECQPGTWFRVQLNLNPKSSAYRQCQPGRRPPCEVSNNASDVTLLLYDTGNI